MRKQQTAAPGTKSPKVEPKSSHETHAPWELVRPVNFEGEDTSLTQEQLAILK